jgi:hypothetical protein
MANLKSNAYVWHVMVMAAYSSWKWADSLWERRCMRRRGDQGEIGLDAGGEMAERGARRAVVDLWGRLHGFSISQLWYICTEARMGISGSSPNIQSFG